MSGPDPLPPYPAETIIRGQRAVIDRLPAAGWVCYLYGTSSVPVAIFGPCDTRDALHEEMIRRVVYGGPARRRRPLAARALSHA